MQGEYIVEVQ